MIAFGQDTARGAAGKRDPRQRPVAGANEFLNDSKPIWVYSATKGYLITRGGCLNRLASFGPADYTHHTMAKPKRMLVLP